LSELNNIDFTVIGVYFLFLVGLGFYLSRRASASLEDYFLGGKKIPWWALGISGMAQFLDITGTMIIVSFLYLLGPRGLFIEFRGGAVLILAFLIAYVGKWHRRSNCMTGAEWNLYRYGPKAGGHTMRVIAVIGTIMGNLGMIAYLVKGVGIFFNMFLPFSPNECAIGLLVVATLYTMVSGFYGVVYTDILQGCIMIFAAIAIVAMGALQVNGYEGELGDLAQKVTGSKEWMSSALTWEIEVPKGYEQYRWLMMFAFFYLLRNVMAGMAEGANQKYFGARNERECQKLSFLNSWCIMIRWPMMMSFAVMGLFMVDNMFPDQNVTAEAGTIIRQHFGDIPDEKWDGTVSEIYKHPDKHPELVSQLKDTLGEEKWQTKLKLISHNGTVNPERILPAVILYKITPGLRGLLLIALISACMSTFDMTVNLVSGFFTRDVYQAYIRPNAKNRELIFVTWVFIILFVAGAYGLAQGFENINMIWDWIIMSLTAAFLLPGLLRLYWWRYNVGGALIGSVVAMIAVWTQLAFFQEYFEDKPILSFCILITISFVGTIIGTYLTPPTDDKVLEHFYRTTKPFGIWGPYKKRLSPEDRAKLNHEHFYDILTVPIAMIWQICLFLLPLQMVIRSWDAFWPTFGVFTVSLIAMYFVWYKHLPPDIEGVENPGYIAPKFAADMKHPQAEETS